MIEHRPPSTYLLRELNDVEVALDVSFIPQTLGWKILACTVLVVLGWFAFKLAKRQWQNRYRIEATQALLSMHLKTDDAAYRAFSVLKRVLCYLNREHAPLHGTAFLRQLDHMMLPEGDRRHDLKSTSFRFNSDLGQRWVTSLINPNEKLEQHELEKIITQGVHWIKVHQVRGKLNDV